MDNADEVKTQKPPTPMDSYAWTHQCWQTSKKLSFITLVQTLGVV